MANPYHAGFSLENDEGRDPFGGAIKKRQQSNSTKVSNQMSSSQYSSS